jgi:hypothetical protein
MTTKVSTFSLRLPNSLKAAVEKLAAADGTSMNQFLVMAAAKNSPPSPRPRLSSPSVKAAPTATLQSAS